jgi:adenylosuccinate synthase
MPITIVVGGQFGSEGKGKVAYALAASRHATHAVRVGGPNSGHTVVDPAGRKVIFRQLPTAALLPDVVCVIPPGAYVDVDILLREIVVARLSPDRVAIDPFATLVTEADRETERKNGLRAAIGSTGSGTGAALQRRIERGTNVLAAGDPRLAPYLRPTLELLRNALGRRERVIVEGTQGYGLSLLHSRHYPYVTSRDTTAAAFLSETGLSPLDVDEIALVLRTFPIRVGGNSGPLPDEIHWATVQSESGSADSLVEYTSVTNAIRRVARFDPTIPRLAIAANVPTTVILNHLDYVDCQVQAGVMTQNALRFVAEVELALGRRVDILGTGPAVLIDRNEHLQIVSRD